MCALHCEVRKAGLAQPRPLPGRRNRPPARRWAVELAPCKLSSGRRGYGGPGSSSGAVSSSGVRKGRRGGRLYATREVKLEGGGGLSPRGCPRCPWDSQGRGSAVVNHPIQKLNLSTNLKKEFSNYHGFRTYTNGRPQRDLFLEFPPPPSEEGAEFPGRNTRAMGQEPWEWRWI